ncbi:MAG: hypothetical protein ACREQB_04250 [Candidatus Binataceae bacterium]
MTNREFFRRIRPYDRFPARAPRVAAADPRRELIRFAFLGAGLLSVVLLVTDRNRFDFVGQLPNGTSIVLYAPEANRPVAPAVVAPTEVRGDSSIQAQAYDSVMALFNRDGSTLADNAAVATPLSSNPTRAAAPAAPEMYSGVVVLTDGSEGAVTPSQNLVDRAVAAIGGLVNRDSLGQFVRTKAKATGDMLDELRFVTARHMTFFEDQFGIDRSAGATWLIVMGAGLLVFTVLVLLIGKMSARADDNYFAHAHAMRYAARR